MFNSKFTFELTNLFLTKIKKYNKKGIDQNSEMYSWSKWENIFFTHHQNLKEKEKQQKS
jgi:hypothetical protein